jgi:hypothetical protein
LVKNKYTELSYHAETILLSKIIFIVKVTLTFNLSVYWIFTKLGHIISLWKGKNAIYCGVIRLKVKGTMTLTLDLNDPKINSVLPLPQGNHVAKFGQDPIYRNKVIVRSRSPLL